MISELIIAHTLKNLGVSANLTGYFYLKHAVQLMLEDPDSMRSIINKVYTVIAEKHNTTWRRVEKAIRHAIETAWTQGDLKLQQKLFGYSISVSKDKPTNSAFIVTIADWLTMVHRQENTEDIK